MGIYYQSENLSENLFVQIAGVWNRAVTVTLMQRILMLSVLQERPVKAVGRWFTYNSLYMLVSKL